MIINDNVSSINALNSLNKTENAMSSVLEKLSSGYRINRASDDAAGLAISEAMKAQISGLGMAKRNAQDGVSLIQTAEGGLTEIQSMLQRMRELAVQASNGTYSSSDKSNMNEEVKQLSSEIDNIAKTTTFNNINLLNMSAGTVSLQIGVNATDTLKVNLTDATSSSLGVDANAGTAQIDLANDASGALTKIDDAIKSVSTTRAKFGSFQNRLEHTMNNLSTASENLTSAESRIKDVDMASAMADLTKNQVLLQAGTSMVSQANAKSQYVLKLLG